MTHRPYHDRPAFPPPAGQSAVAGGGRGVGRGASAKRRGLAGRRPSSAFETTTAVVTAPVSANRPRVHRARSAPTS